MPATSEWDVDEVVAAALQQLRLGDADTDLQRIQESAEAAVVRVDHHIDHEVPGPVTATMFAAAVQLTVEQYTRPANAFDSYAFGVQVGGDPMRNVESMLAPDKERWGVA